MNSKNFKFYLFSRKIKLKIRNLLRYGSKLTPEDPIWYFLLFLESTEIIQKAWYPQELTSPSQNKCLFFKIRFCKDKLTNLEILILPKYVHVTVIYIRIHFISKKIIYHDMILLYDFGFIF